MKCKKCNDTGVEDTGNNDLPCDCPAGETALFNLCGVEGPVTGAEVKKHFLNGCPEPIKHSEAPHGKIRAADLPGRTPMTDLKQVLKKKISAIVNGSTGIKLMELVSHELLVDYYTSEAGERYDFSDLVEELVSSGEIVEVEYCLPRSDRIKSFLLPGKSKVNVRIK
ncbi:MAG: hypothetical protein PHC68_09215 [Syntrophorhabdaceae bacterium]|nr:hypothetical protein [Syntrophorhabdaceae bacterium]